MQPPPKPWKQGIFAAIAKTESMLRRRPAYSHADLQRLRNFLVLQYESPLGSVVHATPFFEALKVAMPHAHVTVAASSMAASVLQHSPFVDRCVTTADPFQNFRKTVSAVRGLLGTLPPGPACIVTTVGNRRPRIALLALLAGNEFRAGHTAAPQLYDCPLVYVPACGQIEGNLEILRALGHDVPFCEPRIFFTAADVDHAKKLLLPCAKIPDAPRVAVVTQNSGGQRNGWPVERFQQISASLSKMCAAIPIFVGTAADSIAVQSIRRALTEPGISLAGKTTVPQLAAVLAQCDLVVSLDTGTFHVARAVCLPGVVIAPAWQNPVEWLPVNHSRYRVLRGPSLPGAPINYQMEEIHPSAVMTAVLELLRAFPASPQAREERMQRALIS